MQNPIINELLNKTLTPKDILNLSKQVGDYKDLLSVLQNHPNIEFESVEAYGTKLRYQNQ